MAGTSAVPLASPLQEPKDGFLGLFQACPWCGGNGLRGFLEEDGYSLSRCEECEVAFVNPQPDDARLTASYIPGYYYTQPNSRNVAGHLRWKEFDFSRIWPLIQDLQGGQLLDVGCGIGGFLCAAKLRGFRATGIELSEEAASFGRQRFGLDILSGSISDHDLQQQSFSVISLYHVLEHLRDPAGELQKLESWLVPGGVMIIECPNLASHSARIFGRKWFHLELPRHLFHFTMYTVLHKLQELGLEILDWCDYHPAHGAASFHSSLYKPESGLPLLEKIRRRGCIFAVRLISRPLAFAESLLGGGSIFQIVARKPR